MKKSDLEERLAATERRLKHAERMADLYESQKYVIAKARSRALNLLPMDSEPYRVLYQSIFDVVSVSNAWVKARQEEQKNAD